MKSFKITIYIETDDDTVIKQDVKNSIVLALADSFWGIPTNDIKRVESEEIENEDVICPVCNCMTVTKIYKPEVYEYSYFCENCQKGFN